MGEVLMMIAVGDTVLISVHKNCPIRAEHVPRQVAAIVERFDKTWYKVGIGTNSRGGITYNTYPQSAVCSFKTITAPLYTYQPYKPLKCRKSLNRKFARKMPVRARAVGQVARMEKIA
jgi:hypothetical protein